MYHASTTCGMEISVFLNAGAMCAFVASFGRGSGKFPCLDDLVVADVGISRIICCGLGIMLISFVLLSAMVVVALVYTIPVVVCFSFFPGVRRVV